MTATSLPTSALDTQTPLSLLYPDLNSEFAITRRVLERVPDNNDAWRPHEKSMALGMLATHIAQLPGLGMSILTTDEFDGLNDRPAPPDIRSNADRLKLFDDLSGKLASMLGRMTWEQAASPWRFRMGDRVLVEGPRGPLIRTMVLTHTTHHRAQLGVFLRLLGIPVPGSYGPSADEPNPPRR